MFRTFTLVALLLPSLVFSLPTAPQAPVVPNRYIVTLKKGVSSTGFLDGLKNGTFIQDGESEVTYHNKIVNGFSGLFTGSVLSRIQNAAEVEAVEPDTIMTINTQQTNADWGLQRISQTSRLSRTDTTVTDYLYNYKAPAGSGTYIYVIDTGVRATHTDFGGRAKLVAQFGGYALADGNGHGTHCAGTAAGTRWGVAKNAQIRGVKVLSDQGSGATSDIIAGIDYVVQQYQANGAPTVASMSLGGTASTALDRAVSNAVAAGVHFAVAAGNDNADACNTSPARAASANTVGAIDITDARASYSNYGSCVDVFAPGTAITSAWSTSDTATNKISGTSMATPHVAGLIAYYLSQQNISPSAMSSKLKSTAQSGAISGLTSSSPNLLVYNGGA